MDLLTFVAFIGGLGAGAASVALLLGRDSGQRRPTTVRIVQDGIPTTLLSESMAVGVFAWELPSERMTVTPAWRALLGIEHPGPGNREGWLDLVLEEDREVVRLEVEDLLQGSTAQRDTEIRMQHRDGSIRTLLTRLAVERDRRGRARRLAGLQIDISERKQAEEQLLHDAFHDALTGLANRAVLMDRLEGVIARARRHDGYRFALLFLDLDGFKEVNDRLGHDVGDQVLVETAERLLGCVREGDTVSRLGGDEFAVLLDDIETDVRATEVSDRIHQRLITPFRVSGQEVHVTASIGIALSRSGHAEAADVLRNADAAMYRAKAAGKARHEVFDTAMHDRTLHLVMLETELRRVVERGQLDQLDLEFQPIVRLEDGSVEGVEALVRWVHPLRGAVPQPDLMSVAEDSGLIVPVGAWVLETACRKGAEWRRLPGWDELLVAVNLSGREISHEGMVASLELVLESTGLEGSALRLEIQERILREAFARDTELLRRLQAWGVGLHVDDFGIDYSSVQRLSELPVAAVKLAPALVRASVGDRRGRDTAEAVVRMASSLGIAVVAEGVERAEEAQVLIDIGCGFGQGFHLGRPVDADAVTDRLTGRDGVGPAAEGGQ